jgi:hypothetical protein
MKVWLVHCESFASLILSDVVVALEPYIENKTKIDKQKQKQKELNLNETIVTLRLPKKYYRTGIMIYQLLGYPSFEDYVNDCVMVCIDRDVNGGGSLDINIENRDVEKHLLGNDNNDDVDDNYN